MSSRNDHERKKNESMSEGIKDTAGAAFHAIHGALETTENAAMKAVDTTAAAINDLKENDDSNE